MYLAELLKGLPGNEIVAACDVYEPRRLEAVEKMGPQTKPANDYREVLDRGDIDAVVIGGLEPCRAVAGGVEMGVKVDNDAADFGPWNGSAEVEVQEIVIGRAGWGVGCAHEQMLQLTVAVMLARQMRAKTSEMDGISDVHV